MPRGSSKKEAICSNIEDRRRDYGEPRFAAIGEIDGEIMYVVYTWRGAIRRIISARHASRRERDAYCKAFGKSNR
ncbi:MAG: BrnT family toxin [Candidatus Binataceae bacterium]